LKRFLLKKVMSKEQNPEVCDPDFPGQAPQKPNRNTFDGNTKIKIQIKICKLIKRDLIRIAF
jgi:hypothetical protein